MAADGRIELRRETSVCSVKSLKNSIGLGGVWMWHGPAVGVRDALSDAPGCPRAWDAKERLRACVDPIPS